MYLSATVIVSADYTSSSRSLLNDMKTHSLKRMITPCRKGSGADQQIRSLAWVLAQHLKRAR